MLSVNLLNTHNYVKLYTLKYICKGVKMRTNIVLDDALVNRAQELTGIHTKREVINTALRTLVRLKEQSSVRALRGKLHWEGDLAEMRRGRSHVGG
jgi:Arc/MetJ family transcription regulator